MQGRMARQEPLDRAMLATPCVVPCVATPMPAVSALFAARDLHTLLTLPLVPPLATAAARAARAAAAAVPAPGRVPRRPAGRAAAVPAGEGGAW
jgi:hypothetical protein